VQRMTIYGVSFDMVGKQPIVLLKTVDGNKFLPIWIGHPEAAAILMKLQGASTPRPMTHDLLSDLLDQIDAKCERVSAPIFAAEDVIEESAIEFEQEVEDPEEVVEKFKDFLDQVTPEDFAKGEE
jgi:bifunctional DNase/RNase